MCLHIEQIDGTQISIRVEIYYVKQSNFEEFYHFKTLNIAKDNLMTTGKQYCRKMSLKLYSQSRERIPANPNAAGFPQHYAGNVVIPVVMPKLSIIQDPFSS